jgi:hypothetical protein
LSIQTNRDERFEDQECKALFEASESAHCESHLKLNIMTLEGMESFNCESGRDNCWRSDWMESAWLSSIGPKNESFSSNSQPLNGSI